MNCQTSAKIPLSYQQKRAWQQQLKRPLRRATCWVELYGPLDPDRLRDSIQIVVNEHEILRTSVFTETECVPSQEVQARADFIWAHKDLRGADEQVDAALMERWHEDQVDSGKYGQEAALRVLLATFSHDRHLVLLSLPALCADGASMQRLVELIGSAYRGGLNSQDDIFQYSDYAAWQHEMFTADEAAAGRDFWRQYFRELDLGPALSGSAAGRNVGTLQTVSVDVDASLISEIEAFSRRHGTSSSDLLLSCWQLLLRRTTLQDVAISFDCDGRNYPEFQNALGPFSRWIPMRVVTASDTPFSAHLNAVKRTVAELRRWQQSFSGLPEHDVADEATPETAFDYADLWGERQYGNITFKLAQLESASERFALRLSAQRQGNDLRLEFRFDNSRFDQQTIQEWSESYLALLAAAIENAQCPVAQLPIVSESQRHRMLVDWNRTAAEYPRAHCIHELIEQQAERTPDRVAVRCLDQRLTYQQLDERTNQVAHWLRTHGVGPDQRVGLCTDRSLDMVVGLVGILKAGGAYVPLNPEHPPLRLAQQLRGSVAMVTDNKSVAVATKFEGAVLCLNEASAQWRSCPPTKVPSQTTPENIAYVLFTSGSTGVPKGVAVRHRNLVNYTWFARRLLELQKFPDGLQFAMVSTVCADVGNTCIYPALTSGGCLHVIPFDIATDSARYGNYSANESIDVLKIVPSHLSALLAAGGGEAVLPRKYLVVGGERLTRELMEMITQQGVGCEVINHYAPTETTCGSLILRLSEFDWRGWRGPSIPLGRPISNTRLYVLDAERQPVPIGAKGELYIAGDGVSAGYVDDPQRTHERFLPDPFVTGSTMYRSGDVVRHLADGNIEFVERIDDQVKVRGFRVELGEVQAVLESHGEVTQAVVLARDRQPGSSRLLAWVVPKCDSSVSGEELREYLRQRLPDYMLPAEIVVLAKFPLTQNGKIDRLALPEPEAVARNTAPRTPIEELVAAIWREVLDREQIGIEENFFEIGGHSLLATQIIGRLSKRIDVAISVRTLFEHPTIAGFAAELEQAQRQQLAVAPPAIVPVPRNGPLPLSFAQERLWMLDQFEPRNPIYNIPRAWRLKGPLQVSALLRSLDEIVRRHESQRTTFALRDRRPVQVIAETLHIPLATYDMSPLPPQESENAARRIIEDEMLRPFDLERGPLSRAYLLRLSAEEHVLLLVSHHIVSDAWSAAVFFRELKALYEAFSQGLPSPFPELKLQYGDYAAQEREWMRGEVYEKHLAYWRQELAGAPQVLELPTDRPRSNARAFRGSCESVRLSPAVSDNVKQLSRAEATSPFTVAMAAFQMLLWRYSGQPQIVVGTDVANRSTPEVEGMLGFFVNILPIRSNFSGSATFRDVVRGVRQCLLGAYAHQQFPFARMVQELQPGRTNRHNPLVQALFVFQNAPRTQRALAGLQVDAFPLPVNSSKFDLSVFMAEDQDTLVGHWVYSTDLFERATILEMSRRFETLLESVLLNPDARLDSFDRYGSEKPGNSHRLSHEADHRGLMVFGRRQESPPHPDSEYAAARTPMEEAISAIWCEVLDRNRIGVEENLFEIGGHSLTATQIAARLRSRLGLDVYVRTLFDHPTIRDLARAIDEAGNDLIAPLDLGIAPMPRVATED